MLSSNVAETVAWGQRSGAPLVIAHRGASAVAVENTEAAFVAAIDAGADGVELDVRLTAGGDVVVFHDDTLERLSGRRDRVDALSLRELRRVPLIDGHRVLTLAEALEVLAGLLVNVEIKAGAGPVPRRLAEHTVRVIEHSGAGHRVLVSSFHPIVLAQVRRLSRLPVGYLFHGEQGLPLRRNVPAHLLRAQAVHPHFGLAKAARVRAWHRHGFAVNVWTVDDDELTARLVRAGVDSLITNDPAATRLAIETALA